jgi:two-component system cell cycle response regulator
MVMVTGEQEAFRPQVESRDQFALTVLAGPNAGSLIMMDGDEMVIGRGEEATVRVDDEGLSRKHVRIFRKNGGYWIEDLKSTNGTFINGVTIPYAAPLNNADRIQLGRTLILRFQLQDKMEREAARRLYDNAVRDPLTRLYNRRFMDERLKEEFAYSVRHQSALSVILMDIDHFKAVNDTYGHVAGDEVLRQVAMVVQETVRVEDVATRYGGEEFCVIARGIEASGAMSLAERLRSRICGLLIDSGDDQLIRITSSFGVATFDHLHPFVVGGALIEAADAALYHAKDTGRDRSCHANDPEVMPSR